jgi:hypothetical protein
VALPTPEPKSNMVVGRNVGRAQRSWWKAFMRAAKSGVRRAIMYSSALSTTQLMRNVVLLASANLAHQ